jgi:hypothetical protein
MTYAIMSGASEILDGGYHDYGNGLIIKSRVPIKYLKSKYPGVCPVKSDYCEIKNADYTDCPGKLACTKLVLIKNGTVAVPFTATFNHNEWQNILSKTEELYGKVARMHLDFPREIQDYARKMWNTELHRYEYTFKVNKGFLIFSETHGVDLFGGTNKPITSWEIMFMDKLSD